MQFMHALRIRVATCCFVLLSISGAKATTPFVTPDALLKHYAQFGDSEDESLVTIHGDVGVSAGGTLHVFAPSSIYGDVYIDNTATFTDDKGDFSNIHGARHYNQNLSAEQNQVYSSASYLSSLPADQTFTNLTTAQFWSAPVANTAYVVNITNLNLNNANITFSGLGYLVLNVTGSFTLGGTASILAAAGTSANHIYINYTGKNTMNTHVGDEIDGRLFITKGPANLDGTFKGGIYSGNKNKVTLLSGATVTVVSP